MVYRDGAFVDSGNLCCIIFIISQKGAGSMERNMSVKELMSITTRGSGYGHGAVSPLVNVSPNCDSDSYAEMWNKQKSNAMRIGCDYISFDTRNLPYSSSRQSYRNPSNDHRRREPRFGRERQLCAVHQT
jgi:hypothetical protein